VGLTAGERAVVPGPGTIADKQPIYAKELIWEIVSVDQYGTVCGKAENNPNT
jgi:hypothetical protein